MGRPDLWYWIAVCIAFHLRRHAKASKIAISAHEAAFGLSSIADEGMLATQIPSLVAASTSTPSRPTPN